MFCRFFISIQNTFICIEMVEFISLMNEYFRAICLGFDKCLQQKSKDVWWACITRPRKPAKLSWSSLLLGAIAGKATSPDLSDWLCSVSLPISVFFTHSLHDVLSRTRDSSKTSRPYSLYPKVKTPTANFWA